MTKESRPKYYYARRFNYYNIYETEPNGNGKKIDDAQTQEEAREKVYKLNGWEYKPKTK